MRVFYLVQYASLYNRDVQYAAPGSGVGFNGGTTLKENAQQFMTIADVLHAINMNGVNRDSSDTRRIHAVIIKVTEVPGATIRVITATRVIDMAKPVVVRTCANVFMVRDRWDWAWDGLDGATVFTDGNDAITYISNGTRTYNQDNHSPEMKLFNVEERTTDTTYTERVIQ